MYKYKCKWNSSEFLQVDLGWGLLWFPPIDFLYLLCFHTTICPYHYCSAYRIDQNLYWFISVYPQLHWVIKKQRLYIIHSLLPMVYGLQLDFCSFIWSFALNPRQWYDHLCFLRNVVCMPCLNVDKVTPGIQVYFVHWRLKLESLS